MGKGGYPLDSGNRNMLCLLFAVAHFLSRESVRRRTHRPAMDIIERKPTPPAVFIKHQLITPDNVDHFYPNDGLLALTESLPA